MYRILVFEDVREVHQYSCEAKSSLYSNWLHELSGFCLEDQGKWISQEYTLKRLIRKLSWVNRSRIRANGKTGLFNQHLTSISY